ERRRWTVWLVISLAGVAAGLRFFPRYYFQILPVVVLLAARGFAQMRGQGGAGLQPAAPTCGRSLSRLLRERLARVSASRHAADSPGALCAHVFSGGAGCGVAGYGDGSGQPRGGGDGARGGEARRHAVRVGVPAGDLRIRAPAGGNAVSGFAAADGRAGGPASDAIDAGGDRGVAGAAGGVGGVAAYVCGGWAGGIQSAAGAHGVRGLAGLDGGVSRVRAQRGKRDLPAGVEGYLLHAAWSCQHRAVCMACGAEPLAYRAAAGQLSFTSGPTGACYWTIT